MQLLLPPVQNAINAMIEKNTALKQMMKKTQALVSVCFPALLSVSVDTIPSTL